MTPTEERSTEKVLVALSGADVSPRFDLTTEVLIARVLPDGTVTARRTVVLPHPSAEDLCHLVITEEVSAVICGGIEDEFHEYLTWKKVRVLDTVMGSSEHALAQFAAGELRPEANLFRTAAEERADA